jgi:formamidopyrimidine-DNA glycosylase
VPELPEVEVVRTGLAQHVVGRAICDAQVLHARAARRHIPGPDDLGRRLVGRTPVAASRRGKYLWLPLDGRDHALLAHLGMSGQLLVSPVGTADPIHLRARLRFTDGGGELRFVDQRTFGGLALEPLVDDGAGGAVPASVAHIARDALDPDFDDAAFVRALRRRHTGIKRALLDQSLVSGIGNIYADEALWRSRMHWATPTEEIAPVRVRGLLGHARDVMAEALAQGGTSFDALYVDVNGESGYFERSLSAYGQEGLPCPRCGTPIRREAFANRSSYRCPRCQRTPRRPRP